MYLKRFDEIYNNFKYFAEYLIDIKKSERSNFENWYVIEIANPRDFKRYLKSGFLGFNFPMSRELAQKEKENLRIIATIRIKKPICNSTINPWRSNGRYSFIFAEVVQFWIYNLTTGEIYLKIKS